MLAGAIEEISQEFMNAACESETSKRQQNVEAFVKKNADLNNAQVLQIGHHICSKIYSSPEAKIVKTAMGKVIYARTTSEKAQTVYLFTDNYTHTEKATKQVNILHAFIKQYLSPEKIKQDNASQALYNLMSNLVFQLLGIHYSELIKEFASAELPESRTSYHVTYKNITEKLSWFCEFSQAYEELILKRAGNNELTFYNIRIYLEIQENFIIIAKRLHRHHEAAILLSHWENLCLQLANLCRDDDTSHAKELSKHLQQMESIRNNFEEHAKIAPDYGSNFNRLLDDFIFDRQSAAKPDSQDEKYFKEKSEELIAKLKAPKAGNNNDKKLASLFCDIFILLQEYRQVQNQCSTQTHKDVCKLLLNSFLCTKKGKGISIWHTIHDAMQARINEIKLRLINSAPNATPEVAPTSPHLVPTSAPQAPVQTASDTARDSLNITKEEVAEFIQLAREYDTVKKEKQVNAFIEKHQHRPEFIKDLGQALINELPLSTSFLDEVASKVKNTKSLNPRELKELRHNVYISIISRLTDTFVFQSYLFQCLPKQSVSPLIKPIKSHIYLNLFVNLNIALVLFNECHSNVELIEGDHDFYRICNYLKQIIPALLDDFKDPKALLDSVDPYFAVSKQPVRKLVLELIHFHGSSFSFAYIFQSDIIHKIKASIVNISPELERILRNRNEHAAITFLQQLLRSKETFEVKQNKFPLNQAYDLLEEAYLQLSQNASASNVISDEAFQDCCSQTMSYETSVFRLEVVRDTIALLQQFRAQGSFSADSAQALSALMLYCSVVIENAQGTDNLVGKVCVDLIKRISLVCLPAEPLRYSLLPAYHEELVPQVTQSDVQEADSANDEINQVADQLANLSLDIERDSLKQTVAQLTEELAAEKLRSQTILDSHAKKIATFREAQESNLKAEEQLKQQRQQSARALEAERKKSAQALKDEQKNSAQALKDERIKDAKEREHERTASAKEVELIRKEHANQVEQLRQNAALLKEKTQLQVQQQQAEYQALMQKFEQLALELKDTQAKLLLAKEQNIQRKREPTDRHVSEANRRYQADPLSILRHIHNLHMTTDLKVPEKLIPCMQAHSHLLRTMPFEEYLFALKSFFQCEVATKNFNFVYETGLYRDLLPLFPSEVGFDLGEDSQLTLRFWQEKLSLFAKNKQAYGPYHILALFLIVPIEHQRDKFPSLEATVSTCLDRLLENHHAPSNQAKTFLWHIIGNTNPQAELGLYWQYRQFVALNSAFRGVTIEFNAQRSRKGYFSSEQSPSLKRRLSN